MTVGPTAVLALFFHVVVQGGFIARALLRPNREPSSRVAWVLVILAVPIVGIVAYFLFGETNIGRERLRRYQATRARLEALPIADRAAPPEPACSPEHAHLFRLGRSVSGMPAVSGNRFALMADSDAAIDALVADIDGARHHVHLLFYIWLPDRNGLRVAEAVKHAARRGVAVRAMADDVGSRLLIRSDHWAGMEKAGVTLVRALPASNPFLHPIRGRIDLRNHRKIAVIDNRITYCGSQNCADAEFRIKAKYAPWVDIMVRIEGPLARQNQALFAGDWMAHRDDDLTPLLLEPPPPSFANGATGQVVGTGPTVRSSAMPEMFEVLFHAARHDLFVTTPYYVPSEAMHAALVAAGHRGVRATLILPARNDSWIVGAASRSYYAELLAAGVRIFEYEKGLLHAKTLTFDGRITLLGSANLDRRSFELNYENNILFESAALTAAVRQRQEAYLADSRPVTADDVAAWSVGRRLWNNAVGMFGPIL